MEKDKIAILLATYNSFPHIEDQIQSILFQKYNNITIYVSDDGSKDNTLEYLWRLKSIRPLIKIINRKKNMGNAGLSFLQLIYDVNLEEYQYVAFADQDDIWLPSKLTRAVDLLKQNNAKGYSANDIAFWPNGRCITSQKSLPQRKFDHYFESIGRGCSYVMCAAELQKFKDEILCNGVPLINHIAHDWLIYSYFRENGLKWYADNHVCLLYRQHDYNSFGINSGFKAALMRYKLMRKGWYSEEIKNILNLVNPSLDVDMVLSRRWILKNFKETRRASGHRILLLLYVLIFKLN